MIKRLQKGLVIGIILVSGASAWSQTCLLPGTPAVPNISNVGSTTLTISWSSALNANAYRVYYSSDGGITYIGTGIEYSSTTFAADLSSLIPGVNYLIYVEAVRHCISGGTPDEFTADSGSTGALTFPVAPLLNEAACSSPDPNSITFAWTTVTCDGYYLDISASSTFTSYVQQNKVIAGPTSSSNSQNSLAPGTSYYYQLRSYNSRGASAYSTRSCAIPTLPVPISLIAPTNVTLNSFTVNWQTTNGNATSYKLDVSTAQNFSTFLTGYNDLTVSGTSQDVTGLSSGVPHYYRVRAFTTGATSANSSSLIKTISSSPTAGSAIGVSTTSFSANWNATVGADSYQLDVATDNTFTSLLPAYSNLMVNSTSQSVSGIASGTSYYYRVRAVNASGASSNSNVIGVLTLPSAPVADVPFSVTTSGFSAKWETTNGAVNYKLDVSSAMDFSVLLPGYNDLTVSSTVQVVSSLSAGTSYYYRVRAVDASGVSANSNQISLKTISAAPVVGTASNIQTNSFTANWSAAAGADSYQLDVAADAGFISLLTDYSNLAVSNSPQSVTSLSAGSTYYYRVRAVNASGASVNSGVTGVITIPPPPVTDVAMNITTSGFTANWETTNGAASYRLDVASVVDFSSILTSYTDQLVNTTSQSVTGLSSGMQYYYRVRAVDASGTSISSNQIGAKTISLAPNAQPASSLLTTSFTANWNVSFGAENYRLDVSTDANFSSILTDYNDKVIDLTSTNYVVSGLLGGAVYYYRLRAFNSGGTSVNSAVVSALTLPVAPPNFRITQQPQPTIISLEWDPVATAAEYDLDVSTDDAFNNLLTGYNPKIISAGFTSQVVSGLSPLTVYYFRIKSRNGSGLSQNYSFKTVSTTSADGPVPIIQLSSLQAPDTYITRQSTQQNVSINISGGQGTLTVDFYHKKNSETAFTKETIISFSSTYTVSLEDAWFDAFGLEFYFEVTDLTNQVKTEPIGTGTTHTILSGVSSFTLPVNAFGKELKNYRIISFPYALAKTKIEDILVPLVGEYNRSSWRFVKYQDGDNKDYQNDGIRISDVAQGEGYWFISKNEINLTFSNGKSYGNSRSTPFLMSLKKGWNQIGNPFPYNISWQDVLASNTTSAVDPDLLIFDKETASFASGDSLKVFEGGFVFANNDTQLTFPVTLKQKNGRLSADQGGRISAKSSGEEIQNPPNWTLPIQLVQGELTSVQGAIGMNVSASDGKDRYDKITFPRFFRYVEFNSSVPDFDYELSQNIASPKENCTWSFNIESNSKEAVEIKWSKQTVAALTAQLIFYDQTRQILIDMSKLDAYTTVSGARISIYYSKSRLLDSDQVELGKAYPNPFNKEVVVPYNFSTEGYPDVEFTVYDLSGRILAHKIFNSTSTDSAGIQMIKWDGSTQQGSEVGSGMYLYKIRINKEGQALSFNGKVIKQ